MNRSILFLASTILLLAIGCTKDFENLNTNPNAPAFVEPSLLLRQVLYNYGDEMAYEGFVAGNLLGQYFTEVDFNDFDRHNLLNPQLGGNPWPVIYRNLRDNQIMLDQSTTEAKYAVYEGPALILKAYMTGALTDIYGNVPFSEALQGKAGILRPKYDPQSDIYLAEGGIFDLLDQAILAISAYEGIQTLDGDILYSGNLSQWTSFAHSLKVKYLMRISDKIDVSQELQSIFLENAFIANNASNATFDFSAGQPNNFRMANLREGDFNLFVLSETQATILNTLNDPRLGQFFRPSENSGEFIGLLNGPDPSTTSISIANYSLAGEIFREDTSPLDANFMTAWETHFLLAEAAHKGLISADAQSLYELGIAEAFAYWGVDFSVDYLSGPAGWANNGQDPLEQIITQKWIANSINGYEGWIEWRRTGFPQLLEVSASLNGGLIPVRMPYPTDEAALNTTNYNAAAAQYNGNSINEPVWWDE